MAQSNTKTAIKAFDFEPGRILAKKYEVLHRLGVGWESEVYLVKEINTGIEQVAKFFFPSRNKKNKTVIRHAQRLNKLRNCSIITQYYTQDTLRFRGQDITFLVSEYVEGEILKDFIAKQPGKRLHAFQALHLLYALAQGMDPIHSLREYHGDLHGENIIIHRVGMGFELKLLDMYHWDNSTTPENIQEDVYDLIRIFYDCLGGAKHYKGQPKVIKDVCCGLRRTSIKKKFRNANQLQRYLSNLRW